MDPYQPLLPGHYYHVVSRAVGNEKIFYTDENYRFFLRRYQKYIQPVAQCYAYTLLPNHFHFLIRTREEDILEPLFRLSGKKNAANDWQGRFLMQQWSNLLNSYTKSLNKRYARKGSLFIDAIRRMEIADEAGICYVAFYIHKNPVHHGLCKKMQDWKWSSYNAVRSQMPTLVERDSLLQLFGGRDHFEQYHLQPVFLKPGLTEE